MKRKTMRKPKPTVIKALAAAMVLMHDSLRGDSPLHLHAGATVVMIADLAERAGYSRAQELRELLADPAAATADRLDACERLIVAVGEAPIILALGIAARNLGKPS